jgi:hypothetical protein
VGGFGGIFTGAVRNGADGNGDGQDGHQRGQQDMRGGGQAEPVTAMPTPAPNSVPKL